MHVACALLAAVALLAAPALPALIPDSTLGLSELVYGREADHDYIGSPTIIRHGSALLAAVEHFDRGPLPECAPGIGPAPAGLPVQTSPFAELGGDARATAATPHFTFVYESVDEGLNWALIGNVSGMHFMTLFEHTDKAVYGIGTGPGVNVAKSVDGGRSWAVVQVLNNTYSGGSTPVLYANGLVVRALEATSGSGGWPFPFHAALLFAKDTADLMDPASWSATAPLAFDRAWIPAEWARYNWTKPGFLEGNPVPCGDGICNLLRVNSLPMANKGCLLKLAADMKTLEFQALIDFPGGMSKFDVRFDKASERYITLSNTVSVDYCPSARNNLTFSSSTNLLNWTNPVLVLSDDTGFSELDSMRYTGFHYVSWFLEGSTMHALIRTAYRGANSYHNSNRITYKAFSNFRSWLLASPDL